MLEWHPWIEGTPLTYLISSRDCLSEGQRQRVQTGDVVTKPEDAVGITSSAIWGFQCTFRAAECFPSRMPFDGHRGMTGLEASLNAPSIISVLFVL